MPDRAPGDGDVRISIQARVWIITAVAAGGFLALGVLATWEFDAYRRVQQAVTRTQEAMRAASALEASLSRAESAVRGFVITGADEYVAIYEPSRLTVFAALDGLRDVTRGDGPQAERVERLGALVADKMRYLTDKVNVRRELGQEQAVTMLSSRRGKELMDAAVLVLDEIVLAEEARLGAHRVDARKAGRIALVIGAVAVAVVLTVLILSTFLVARAVARPVRALVGGIEHVARGDYAVRLGMTTNTELDAVGAALDHLAGRLTDARAVADAAEAELRRTNEMLVERTRSVETRERTIALLARTSERLHGCTTEAEIGHVAERAVAAIVPELGGGLFLFNNSRDAVIEVARWRVGWPADLAIGPGACWALRRGQVHAVGAQDGDVRCTHFADDAPDWSLCTPLVAQGDVLGLLVLVQGAGVPSAGRAIEITRLATTVAEQAALALANLRLRETLRQQTIRDPLTGLYNRRYMEETLVREIARAKRQGSGLAVLMFDVDHFKRFNETFGHDAGDSVLTTVSAVVRRSVRASDVCCRYGGEEFIVVLPDADLAHAGLRAERLRAAIAEAVLWHGGREVGPVTVSIGVAAFPEHGSDRESLVGAADGALRRAKKAGRNRVMAEAARPALAVPA